VGEKKGIGWASNIMRGQTRKRYITEEGTEGEGGKVEGVSVFSQRGVEAVKH